MGATLYNLTPQRLGFFISVPAIGYILGNYISVCCAMRFGIDYTRRRFVGICQVYYEWSIDSSAHSNEYV